MDTHPSGGFTVDLHNGGHGGGCLLEGRDPPAGYYQQQKYMYQCSLSNGARAVLAAGVVLSVAAHAGLHG